MRGLASGLMWFGSGVALVSVALLFLNLFCHLLEPSEVSTVAGLASASAAVAMFVTAWLIREQAEALREQVWLQTDQLRYFYEPGIYLQLHYDPMNRQHQGIGGLPVKVFCTSHAATFRVWVTWRRSGGAVEDMVKDETEDSVLRRARLAPRWNAARVGPGETWWCLLTRQPAGALLDVSWRHVGEWRWEQTWRLLALGNDYWDLVPEGPPERRTG